MVPADGGVLVVGHGTRDAAGTAEFRALVERLAARLPACPVEPCFLELAEPTIAAGLSRLVERGARRIAVLPLLLFAAGHAKSDVPREVAEAAAAWPELRLAQGRHLGCDPRLVALSTQRYREAAGPSDPARDAATLLVFVGRGSRDPEANAELARFARLRWEQTPVGWHLACYLAMTEPALERGLELAAGLPFERIVVQPHLLFQGDLLERTRRLVAEAAAARPERTWTVTPHLGPDPALVEILAEIAAETWARVPLRR